MDTWHELRVSRTAKSGILQVDSQRPMEGIAEVFCFCVASEKFHNKVSHLQALLISAGCLAIVKLHMQQKRSSMSVKLALTYWPKLCMPEKNV